MSDRFPEPIGEGGFWIFEGKKGRYMKGSVTFSYNGSPVTAKIIIFRNKKKEGDQPDFRAFVNDAFPAKPREISKSNEDQKDAT